MPGKDSKLVIVSSEVLPDIISKVLSAKQLKARGEASTSAEACRAVGISRSAYYKYKDSVSIMKNNLLTTLFLFTAF